MKGRVLYIYLEKFLSSRLKLKNYTSSTCSLGREYKVVLPDMRYGFRTVLELKGWRTIRMAF